MLTVQKLLPLAVLGGLALPAAVHADTRDFPFTYEWMQGPKGEREFEVKTTYNGVENAFKQEAEVEYSVSDRLLLAPYVIFEKGGEGKYKYQGYKLESRYRLGEYKRNTILPSLYLEYANERTEAPELEGKLILSRYGKDGSNISFNYIVERPLEHGGEFENLYSLGYARDLSKKSGLRGGLELIHNLSEGQINAGPVLSKRFGSISVVGGYAVHLNSRRGNADQARVNVEYEF